MAKHDHKLFEKDIPKQQREELLKHVFFSSKGVVDIAAVDVFAQAFKALVIHQLRKVFGD